MLTAYDYLLAQLLDEVGIDILLVGDSLAMVVLGYENTLPVTVEEMIYHTKAVVKGRKKALVVADMPFMSFHINVTETVKNAGRFIKEAGAEAVKIEGNRVDSVKAIVQCGIPVMGHIGLMPQHIHQMGGYKVQGRSEADERRLLNEAESLQEAGVFALVLEGIPTPTAQKITNSLTIPTIGIGAGLDCDGQVLVTQDLLGLFGDNVPHFVKKYADLKGEITNAVSSFKNEVEKRGFPPPECWYY